MDFFSFPKYFCSWRTHFIPLSGSLQSIFTNYIIIVYCVYYFRRETFSFSCNNNDWKNMIGRGLHGYWTSLIMRWLRTRIWYQIKIGSNPARDVCTNNKCDGDRRKLIFLQFFRVLKLNDFSTLFAGLLQDPAHH